MSTQSVEIKDLATALAKAQAEIKGAVKDASNPFFKSNYADLQSVWDACRLPLSKNGLSVAQTTDIVGERLVLVTTLLHSSGQWIRGALPVEPVKRDPQGMGSAITYARRYALAAMVGIYQTDDDAEVAMDRGSKSMKSMGPVPGGDGFMYPEGTYRIPGNIGNPALAGRHLPQCNVDVLKDKRDSLLARQKEGTVIPKSGHTFLEELGKYFAENGIT